MEGSFNVLCVSVPDLPSVKQNMMCMYTHTKQTVFLKYAISCNNKNHR